MIFSHIPWSWIFSRSYNVWSRSYHEYSIDNCDFYRARNPNLRWNQNGLSWSKIVGAREQCSNLKSILVEWLNSRGVGVEDRIEDRTEVERSIELGWVILVDLSRTLWLWLWLMFMTSSLSVSRCTSSYHLTADNPANFNFTIDWPKFSKLSKIGRFSF